MNLSSTTPEQGPIRKDLTLLALVCGFLFFVSLGQRDLWNPNEPIYGQAVVEMAEAGNWLVPTVNGKVFAEKPILYFWMALSSSKALGGVSELSLRVPSALAGVAGVLLTYLWVLPYVGRRRALITAALLATSFQVFWASRTVQMDILVLVSTLGVMVPLSRMLDFAMPARRAWIYAGVAAGLGFAAKGPVTLIIPGIAIFGYVFLERRHRVFFQPMALWGVVVTIAVSLPWYALLWSQGELDFLYEVLVRQNFTRFVEAWDHRQPWWYYLKYIWIDYAPWSWLLPAAWLTRSGIADEGRLRKQSWIWIGGVIFFFSLSESKRAPYILPIAPAIAAMAATVVDRWAFKNQSSDRNQSSSPALLATALAFFGFGTLLLVAGAFLLSPWYDGPESMHLQATVLAGLLLGSGLAIVTGRILKPDRPAWVPTLMVLSLATLYLTSAVWVLPTINPMKSAREFGRQIDHRVTQTGSSIVSYQFWDWRVGYVYYSQRPIPNLKSSDDLISYWQQDPSPYVLVEAPRDQEVQSLLPNAELVYIRKIGGRKGFLFTKSPRLEKEEK